MFEELEKEAQNLILQKRFLDASVKYEETAKALEDIPQERERAIKCRAQSRYWYGFHFLMKTKRPRFFRVDDIEKAAKAFGEAERLYESLANQVGVLTARGSKYYMLGERAGLKEDYAEVEESYRKAAEIFSEVLQQPGLPQDFRTDIDTWCHFADRGALFARVMSLLSQPEAPGEIQNLVRDLERVTPQESMPFYESQFSEAQAFARFNDGIRAVERWDSNALDRFKSMQEAIDTWRSKARRIPYSEIREQMEPLIDAWNFVCQGEMCHSKALRYLYEVGDPMRARKELAEAAKDYGRAREEFERAGIERKGIAPVKERASTIYERSKILTEVSVSHGIWIAMGRWFVLFFLIALAGLAGVRRFLDVDFSPELMISTSLFVGLVGSFTRYAHQFLKYIPKPKG